MTHSTCVRVFGVVLALASLAYAADAPKVELVRVPDGGVQPQALIDDHGVIHLIYLKGDPGHSDIFYVRSSDGGATFSSAIRVNSQPGSAVALGTMRGAQLALGRSGRLHVGWTGSTSAEPKAPGKSTPMMYARSNEDGSAFEPQRNLVYATLPPGLDGGSIAADRLGNVSVAWHAPTAKGEGEKSRQVWLTRSKDDGQLFTPEQPMLSEAGVCGCCGTRLFAAGDSLLALYRAADGKLERDMTLLRYDIRSGKTSAKTVAPMQSAMCVMSTSALAAEPNGVAIGAWETSGQIFWSPFKDLKGSVQPIAAPGRAGGRKHPALAANVAGQTLLVWTEGTGWQRGGTISWQLYDATSRPLGAVGHAEALPAWGSPSAVARADGSFVIIY